MSKDELIKILSEPEPRISIEKIRKKYNESRDKRYKRVREVKNLFNLSFDEDYYKPTKTNDSFINNYIEYESKEDKGKTLSIKEYLKTTIPYLSDIINDHKTQGKWEVHSDNTVINYKTQREWKIQLTMTINFMSSKDSNVIRTMYTKSNNKEIVIGNETDEMIRELFKSLLQ